MPTSKSKQTTEKSNPLASQFEQWEKVKDLIDQLIDLTLNYRQSGHPVARARKFTRW